MRFLKWLFLVVVLRRFRWLGTALVFVGLAQRVLGDKQKRGAA